MARTQRWTKWLTASDRVEVSITTEGRDVLDFAVQYLARFGSDWHAIIRFDTGHGHPHVDVLSPGGRKLTRALTGLDNREALTYALSEVDRRWESHRTRYERSLQK
jgi:hypothetical protein